MSDTKKESKKEAKAKEPVREVVFYAYPKLLYAWPLIVMGLVFLPLALFNNVTVDAVLGWVYVAMTCLVVLTLGIDLERNHAVFWAVVGFAILFLGLWLAQHFQVAILGDVLGWLGKLDVSYNWGLGLAVSILLAIPYGIMMIWVRINHKWRITHNEFEHYSMGRADDSLARGAKRVRSTYPDLMELLLCGAGTLVVYSASGRQELRRIENVPMIFRVRKRINTLLEATAVVTDQQHQANLAAEEAEAEDEEGAGHNDSGNAESESVEPGKEPL